MAVLIVFFWATVGLLSTDTENTEKKKLQQKIKVFEEMVAGSMGKTLEDSYFVRNKIPKLTIQMDSELVGGGVPRDREVVELAAKANRLFNQYFKSENFFKESKRNGIVEYDPLPFYFEIKSENPGVALISFVSLSSKKNEPEVLYLRKDRKSPPNYVEVPVEIIKKEGKKTVKICFDAEQIPSKYGATPTQINRVVLESIDLASLALGGKIIQFPEVEKITSQILAKGKELVAKRKDAIERSGTPATSGVHQKK